MIKKIRLCQGNEKFLNDIIIFLKEQYNIEPTTVRQEKENLWSFSYRKNDSLIKLISLLYDDAYIYIKRKKKSCNLIKSEILKIMDMSNKPNCNEPQVS
ncbi:MAG: hypothetical protein UIM53_06050 [Acutalibacteraceae bacterium]|nr:hypothetical protein [Acutalibacteraceae bacterium]